MRVPAPLAQLEQQASSYAFWNAESFLPHIHPAWEPQCPSSQGRKESDEQAAADKADYTVAGCNSENHNADSF